MYGEKVCSGYHPHPSQCPHRQHHLQRAHVWGVICSVFASVGWVVWGEQDCEQRGVRCVYADITASSGKEHCHERIHAISKAQTTQPEPSTSLTRRMRQTRTSLVRQCFHLRNEGQQPPLYQDLFWVLYFFGCATHRPPNSLVCAWGTNRILGGRA